jgi:uncharacterized protein involved in response to NO
MIRKTQKRTIMIDKLTKHYFFSQPHQVFFILAFVNAILSMILFALLFTGTVSSTIPVKLYHVYSIIFLLFTPAFLAFLFTTFPRFSATEPVEKHKYLNIFGLFFVASLFSYFSLFSSSFLPLSMLLSLFAHISAVNILLSIYKTSTVEDKYDQFWILVASAFGVLSQLVLFLSFWFPSLYVLAIQIAIYLYLFLMFFAVSQRMVPFFSHTPITKHKERFKVIVGLLALHVLLELLQPHASFFVDIVLAYLLGRELQRWELPSPHENPLVWILHIALLWIPIAFLLSAVTNLIALSTGVSYLYLGIHILSLGFFLTMIIGFGTRVTLGHSGNNMQVDTYTKYLFYLTQVVVLSRIFTSLFTGEYFFVMFNISVAIWLGLFVFWGYKFFMVLILGKKL